MWTLLTVALRKSPSSTSVAVVNTSANIFLTAFLGMMLFAERLAPMWWAGASLLVAGTVLVGQADGDAAAGRRIHTA